MDIQIVKTALRIKTNAFDGEIQALIGSAEENLLRSGIKNNNEELYKTAVITYCRAHFGNNENAKEFMKAFENQKSFLAVTSNG